MKLITRDTDYALRALIYIQGNKNNVTSVTELVRELKIPKPFLRKLLQRLDKSDILRSHKGKGGGFTLVRQARRISLFDLIEIFQGSLRLNECLFKKKPCPRVGTCGLNKAIGAIEKGVFSKLKSISVASLGRDSW
ncbi:MAG: RrF2 family transcriptional regulator [Deltaproteobacteria bacterium]